MDNPAPTGPPKGFELYPFLRSVQREASRLYTAGGLQSLAGLSAFMQSRGFNPAQAGRMAADFAFGVARVVSAVANRSQAPIAEDVFPRWPGRMEYPFMVDVLVTEYEPGTNNVIGVVPYSVTSPRALSGVGWARAIAEALELANVKYHRDLRDPNIVAVWTGERRL